MTTNILALQKLPQLMSFTGIDAEDSGSCTLCSHTCCCTAKEND